MTEHFKKIEIIAYESVDGVCRIEYKNHVIQIYGYDDRENPDLNITHCVINSDGSSELGEFNCLLKAIKCIDGVILKGGVKMNSKETKKVTAINWLEPCDICGAEELVVKTSRTDGKLDELDSVVCFCGNYGYIDVYYGRAFVCWED